MSMPMLALPSQATNKRFIERKIKTSERNMIHSGLSLSEKNGLDLLSFPKLHI